MLIHNNIKTARERKGVYIALRGGELAEALANASTPLAQEHTAVLLDQLASTIYDDDIYITY